MKENKYIVTVKWEGSTAFIASRIRDELTKYFLKDKSIKSVKVEQESSEEVK